MCPSPIDVKFSFKNNLAKKLLLLDLDETLVHSELLPGGAEPHEKHSFAIDIPVDDYTGEIEVNIFLIF